MPIPSIRRRGRLRVVVTALGAALLMPSAALADTSPAPTIYPAESRGATINLAGGQVTGRLVANTTVTFTCDPFLVYDWETGMEVESTEGRLESGNVTILQAAGRTINFGEIEFWGGTVVCDGATLNRRELGVVASVSPWRSGSAVAGARVFVASTDYNSSHFASTGPVTIKLGR